MKSNYLNAFFGACAGIVVTSNTASAELLSPVDVEITQGQFDCIARVVDDFFRDVPFAEPTETEISRVNPQTGLINSFHIIAGSNLHFASVFIDDNEIIYAFISHPEKDMTTPYNTDPTYGPITETGARAETAIYLRADGISSIIFNEHASTSLYPEHYREHTPAEREIGQQVYSHMQLCIYGGG
jgi:hypothetical protein